MVGNRVRKAMDLGVQFRGDRFDRKTLEGVHQRMREAV